MDGEKSPFHSSYERGCQVKKLLPAPLRDAGVVTYIQPHLIPHLILRGVIGLVALARRTSPRRCQPQLLVPTRRFHEVSGARRRWVAKLRKLSVGLSANQDPMRRFAYVLLQFSPPRTPQQLLPKRRRSGAKPCTAQRSGGGAHHSRDPLKRGALS